MIGGIPQAGWRLARRLHETHRPFRAPAMCAGTIIAGSMFPGTIAGSMVSGTIAGAILVEGSARGSRCYVRVGVGSVVPPPTHHRAKVGITN